ncbi:MAG: hypothetical protein A4E57_02205 [Syntrophorhabdaceae bacterium PtaU1.Bin034]|jgi:hypothetical protein|nr:MAG: hypothetical protein A4E57_02205 [Syntrophorhabdaceae bacterium PtaU1.Bin034]
MEARSKSKRYLGGFLNVALGAGAVISGAYIFSRLKEKRDTETRLERMEQILEKIASEDESGNG